MNNVRLRNIFQTVLFQRFQKFRFPATANARYNLYIRSSDYAFDFFKIEITFDKFHNITLIIIILLLYQKVNIIIKYFHIYFHKQKKRFFNLFLTLSSI